MLDQKDKRVTLLLLVQVLKNHTDARHPLPITGRVSLQSRLCEDYDLPMAPSRNTLGRDLTLLRDGLGYDIHRVPRKGFYLEQRTLTRPQKQLLKDMVERAGFLTTGNRETLLRNLDSLFGKAEPGLFPQPGGAERRAGPGVPGAVHLQPDAAGWVAGAPAHCETGPGRLAGASLRAGVHQ